MIVTYGARTDRTTPLSLTNHTYFNLNGFRDTIHDHRIRILSDQVLEPDDTNVPVGNRRSVTDTPEDFNQTATLGDRLTALPTGFEHYYVFRNHGSGIADVANFTDPESGTSLVISTTEPGALFYTGYFTSDKLGRENGDAFGRYRAFCFETSRYPNGPNLADGGHSILHPGDQFFSKTIYRLIY